MTTPTVVINGKFLSAPSTGVHRVAHEIVDAIDRSLGAQECLRESLKVILAMPPNALRVPKYENIDVITVGMLTWQFWEQISLPRFAGRNLLLNLCNLAPLIRPGIVMIHDAQVHISPESYSKPFVIFYRFLQPNITKRAALVLTVSSYSRNMLSRYGVARREKIEIVHNGGDHLEHVVADPKIVGRLQLAPGKYTVALSTTQKHKNIDLLLQAFGKTQLAGDKLVLIGSTTEKDFNQNGSRVPQNVVFAGRVTDQELKGLFSSATCLAFPSTTEGFGLPPLEAMAVGCPVIAAPCGALPEVCGSAALYADPQDAGAWADAIAGLSADGEARLSLINAGIHHAANFTWDESARRIVSLILEKVGSAT